MKRKIIHGEGIQGMSITLGVAEMFAASQVAEELWSVIENHKDCDNYAKCQYDKRKEEYPNGQPKRIELSEKTLNNLFNLMNNMSCEFKSTLFDEFSNDVDEDAE